MSFLEPTYLLSVLLVFVRIGGLLVAAPVFGQRTIPIQLKVFLALVLAYSLAGLVPRVLPPNITEPLGFALAIAIEALTGVALGFAAQFIFYAVQFAGEIIGFQMALSIAQVYNPINGETSNPVGRFLTVSFMLVFLILDGHHYILRALVLSFEAVPLAGANLAATGTLLLQWAGQLFITALRLAAPFMITIFMIDAALGVFARIIPQADLFSLGLPLKLFAGLGLVYFFLQHFFPLIPGLIDTMYHDLLTLIELLVPA